MDNELDFLDGAHPAEPTAAVSTPEPAAAEPASPQDGQLRGPDGKFISPKATEPAQAVPEASPNTSEPPPAAAQHQPTPEPVKAPDGYVPVTALTELRREFQAFKQSVQQPQAPAPDPYEDFEAYQQWQEAQATTERAEWSRQLAEVKYGADMVGQAREWAAERFAADPVFAQQAASQRDPYSFAIDAWKRDQVLSRLSDPKLLDNFLAFASGQAPQAPAVAQAAHPPPPTPPRSLAAAPNAGGTQPGAMPLHDEAVFDSTFRG